MKHGGDIYTNDIKWDFSVNLNPEPCPESIRKALREELENADRYPDVNQRELRRNISVCENVPEDCIIGGSGASELYFALIRALEPGRVLLPRPGFSGYMHGVISLDDCSTDYYDIRKSSSFVLNEDILEKITEETDLVIITNPNNPTGRIVPEELLGRITEKCKECSSALLIDESFLRMSKGISCVQKIHEYEKLYILSCYTKLFSIPGIRVGYLISAPHNIVKIKSMLPEWNMSVLSQKCASVCADELVNTDFQKRTLIRIETEREKLKNGLSQLGITVYDSDTSFLLIKSRIRLYDKLLERKILIRSCEDFEGLDSDMYRIAVKSKEENDILINAVKEIIQDNDD